MSYKDPCAEDLDHRVRLLIFKIGAFWVVFRSLWHVIELDIGSGTLVPMCAFAFWILTWAVCSTAYPPQLPS